MKRGIYFFVIALISCGAVFKKISLGGNFYYTETDRSDLQMLYIKEGEYLDRGNIARPDFRRFMRGKVTIFFNNENIIIGHLDADNSGFEEELRGVHDKTGYFIIDKKSRKFMNVANVGAIEF